ncbi:MAG: DUF4251 domain-containing protein [Bacteroidetes bacterium]|nr:DUF4251 domain-containing protein [Bacteroidota bacterium]
MKQQLPRRLFLVKITAAIAFSLVYFNSFAQKDTTSPRIIASAIQADRWVFTAERSDPAIGRNVYLSSGYEVRCKGDTLTVNLPYAGTMQGPARFPDGSRPLEFTSTSFTISKVQKSNGKWIVTLKPKDHNDVVSFTFTFFENGKASLDVILTNRSPIDFYGTVEPLK